MKKIILLSILSLFISCNKVKEKAKNAINTSGEIVGKSGTEFVEGITEGVERTLDCEIIISDNLKQKGLSSGKFSIEKDTTYAYNKLVLYLIFDKNFNEKITLKVKDKKELENGRTSLQITEKAGNAHFFEFIFDNRTSIETKSNITIE